MKRPWKTISLFVITLGLLVSVVPNAWSAPDPTVAEAADALRKAVDADPALSPELKDALKQFVSSVEKSEPGAAAPTPAMDKAFARRLDAWFEKKGNAVGESNVIAKYKNGFSLSTTDGAFQLKIGGRVQADMRAFGHNSDDEGRTDSFFLRRARLFASGKLSKQVGFKIQGEFAGATTVLKDGYIQLKHFGDLATLKVGQFKEPFGREGLRSSKYVDFVERSLATDNMAPSRDVGVMVYGKAAAGAVTYAAGIFNGNGSNKKDENSDKDFATRVTFDPFKNCDTELFKGLSLGTSFAHGRQKTTDAGKMFKTAADTTFLTFSDFSGGSRVRYGADMAWLFGPASVQAEWIKSEWKNTRIGDVKRSPTVNGFYVATTYLLTGEKKVASRLTPNENFDPSNGGWGAVELAARFGELRAQGSLQKTGEALAGTTDVARAFTLGVNWYLTPMTLFRLNWINTQFDDSIGIRTGSTKNESTVIGRLQIEF